MLPGLWNRGSVLPFERLWDIRKELDRAFEGETGQTAQTLWIPPMDVVEHGEEIRCHVEVPGMSQDDLDIRVEGNVLTIAGEKKYSNVETDKEAGFRHVERRYGRFERSFTIPQGIEAERVKAHYDNGVLTIVLPKAERARPRRISVEGSGARSENNGRDVT